MTGVEGLENVLAKTAETSTVANEDKVVPAWRSHVHVIDALDSAIDGVDNAIDLTTLSESEALKTNFDISTNALWSLLRGLGGGLSVRLWLSIRLRFYRLRWLLSLFWLRRFRRRCLCLCLCRRRSGVVALRLSSVGLALRLGSFCCAVT